MPSRPSSRARVKNRQVFINCPFSNDYQSHFRAIVFSVIRSGFTPRCALEADDGGENRFSKICRIIRHCGLSVHDISKTELDSGSKLPRFNMPLELGLFLGAKHCGSRADKNKRCIIFDREDYRYQKFISDLAGQDIKAHCGQIEILIEKLAAWLRLEAHDNRVPGGRFIAEEFEVFQQDVPQLCQRMRLDPDELTFQDYRKMAEEWIERRVEIAELIG